jgi:hypothetical protein
MNSITLFWKLRREPVMQGPVESFRIALWVPLAWVLLIATSIGVPVGLAIVFVVMGPPPVARIVNAVCTAVAVGDVVGFLGVCAVVAYFKVSISPGGLSTYNSCCLFRTVSWADIRSVRLSGLPGLRSLKIDVPGARFSLSVPICLYDLERFSRLVRQYAGPEHPLARALNEEMSGGR